MRANVIVAIDQATALSRAEVRERLVYLFFFMYVNISCAHEQRRWYPLLLTRRLTQSLGGGGLEKAMGQRCMFQTSSSRAWEAGVMLYWRQTYFRDRCCGISPYRRH